MESLESLRDYARKLVADYSANGLSGMSSADARLLLSEKQLHLAEVSDRCTQGLEMHVSVPLKRILERDVMEIAKAITEDKGIER